MYVKVCDALLVLKQRIIMPVFNNMTHSHKEIRITASFYKKNLNIKKKNL